MSDRAPHPPRGRRISVRVFSLVGLGMLAPLLVMAWAGWVSFEELNRRALSERELIARHTTERLGTVLSGDMEALHDLGALLGSGAPDPEATRAAVRQLHAHRHELFEEHFVIDAGGEVVDREPAGGPPLDAAMLLAGVRQAGRPHFTNLLTDTHGTRRLFALVPVLDEKGALVKVVGGAIDPAGSRLAAHLRTPYLDAHESVDLIDGEGTVIGSTDRERLGLRTAQSPWLAELISQKHPASGTCSDCGVGPSADRELYAFYPLAAVHWGVRVRQPAIEAWAFAGTLFRNVSLLAVVLLAVALLFAWGAALSVTRPLKMLTRAAERITRGRLDEPIPRLPSDEVGRLGAALELMRQSLKDSLERIAEANAALEQRVQSRTAELEKLNRVLEDREQVRTQLLRKVISAQEDERKRIARELHDETSQSLAALAMGLESTARSLTGPEHKKVGDAAALAVRTLAEVHRLIVDLRPSVLDDLGLQSAIAWYAERCLKPAGLTVRCEFSGLEQRLPRDLETVLFRTAQEAMTNIARHAGAETVLIQCARRDGTLTLEIEDDGKGFDASRLGRPDSSGRGLGLLGMRERVELFGGTLRLESAPDEGTRIELTVPVPEEQKKEAALG